MSHRELSRIRPTILVLLLVVAPLVAGCAEEPENHARFLGPSGRALALLLDDPFRRVEIEVHHAPDARVTPAALEHLAAAVREHTGKEVVLHPPRALDASDPRLRADRYWPPDEVLQLHDDTFTLHDPQAVGVGDMIGLHVVVLNGWSDADGDGVRSVGLAAGNLIALFHGTIPQKEMRSLAPQLYAQRVFEIERSVLVHEFGHILGLVDNGIPMVRDHGDGTGHSRFETSVMFPELETDLGLVEIITGGKPIPYTFDEYDLEDLEAARSARPTSA